VIPCNVHCSGLCSSPPDGINLQSHDPKTGQDKYLFIRTINPENIVNANNAGGKSPALLLFFLLRILWTPDIYEDADFWCL
jgi:hypothetical protein